jgi:hypothetical protein
LFCFVVFEETLKGHLIFEETMEVAVEQAHRAVSELPWVLRIEGSDYDVTKNLSCRSPVRFPGGCRLD